VWSGNVLSCVPPLGCCRQVNLGFSRSIHSQNCGTSDIPYLGLWLPPLLVPVATFAVLTLGFYWRSSTTSRSRQRPWLLRTTAFVFLCTFVWVITNALEVLRCTEAERCDPVRCVCGLVCMRPCASWFGAA